MSKRVNNKKGNQIRRRVPGQPKSKTAHPTKCRAQSFGYMTPLPPNLGGVRTPGGLGFGGASTKYKPHQGYQECERRREWLGEG